MYRLGAFQREILKMLATAPRSVAALTGNRQQVTRESYIPEREYWKSLASETRRALRSLERKGLIYKTGDVEIRKTGIGYGLAAFGYNPTGYPYKGYTRQSSIWALTDKGRQVV